MASDVKVGVERLARRLRIPCHSRDWAIRAMLERSLPDGWMPVERRRSGKHAAAAAAAAVEEDDDGDDGEKEKEGDDGDADCPPLPSVEFEEEEQQQQHHEKDEVEKEREGAAAVRRSRRSAPHLEQLQEEQQEEEAPPPQQQQQHQKKKQRRTSATTTATPPPPPPPAAAAPSSLSSSGFSWEGTPVAPPLGNTATARTYYNAVLLGNVRVAVGSHVELEPLPGETAPRVAKVTSLWAERGVHGEDRPFGRFTRFFRPHDTPVGLSFMLSSQQNQVFRSNFEEQLSLAAVRRPCAVAYPGSAEELAQATPRNNAVFDYVCMLHYDQEQCALTFLPPQ